MMRKGNACGRRWGTPWSPQRRRSAREIARAAALLDPVMPLMTSVGGSDAQDDLFRQTYLRSLQAAGRRGDAAAYFARITDGKAPTPLDRALAS
jgi:hypothetical protein